MNTLVQLVRRQAESRPEHPAVIYRGECLTYGKLYESAARMTALLRSMGLQPGDRVMLEAVPKPIFVAAFLAVQAVGAVTIPVARAEKRHVLDYITELTGARLYLHASAVRDFCVTAVPYHDMERAMVQAPLEEAAPVDETTLLELIFTTGSTGRPKGAMHTAGALWCNIKNTRDGIGMRESDVVLIPLPLNHSFALRVLRSAFAVGATVVLQNSAVSVKETAENIRQFHCTAAISVSVAMETMLHAVGEEQVKRIFGGLRYIEFSAGAVSVPLRKRLLDLLPNTEIHNTWGSSESGGCLFLHVSKRTDKITSAGRPLDGIEVGIVGADGELMDGVGPDTVGRLALRGGMQMSGYYGQEELTRETLRDGWMLVNDLVWRDADGYLYMVGRADDIINVGGEKVAPREIEEQVMQSGWLTECMVLGVEDKKGSMGQVPALFYVAKDANHPVSADELKMYLSRELPQHKVPQEYISLSAIPRNAMGKPDRKALKCDWEIQSSTNETIETIFQRRSIRKFQDKAVPAQMVSVLVECAKAAPSGKNLKTRRFTVIQDAGEIAAFKQVIHEATAKNNLPLNGFENPPLLILISNDRRNQDGIQDAAVSAENIMLAATSLGLGSVWLNALMTLCDEQTIRAKLEEYHIPRNHIVWAMMAIGWPTAPGTAPEQRGNEVYYVGGENE